MQSAGRSVAVPTNAEAPVELGRRLVVGAAPVQHFGSQERAESLGGACGADAGRQRVGTTTALPSV
ncbi:MAG TPA: hypothetical protein VKM72_09655 [Thermoanaerobaculia bacterium]|nr:hypothetical protein [Thermoanaerobaculia bacterium]